MIRKITWTAAAAAALAMAAPLGAQQRMPPREPQGGVSGLVVDAENARPLPGAIVSLEPDAPAALPGGAGGSAFLAGSRAVASDSLGRYRFDQLPPGRYRLRISRTGYRPATVAVELRGAADSRVAVGLSMEPVSLEPVEVRAERRDPFGREAGVEGEVVGARVRAARERQRAHLATDARELTHADVLESVTLGETDLFRALHRAPGVAARDDYGAELWVRGAAWDQTRIYFDGLPLFNPVHGFGLLSGVNADAVGGAVLHPGVRSAALGDAAAGVVDVTSRRGDGDGDIRGLGDLSLTSARLALDRRFLDGRGAWMLAGRRSWIDALGAVVARTIDEEAQLPYSFADLTGRFDLQLDERRALEVSGIWESDQIAGTLPDILHRTRARWGNTAGRVTYAAPLARFQSRHTLGLSHYAATIRETPPDTVAEGSFSAPGEPRSDNLLSHAMLMGELTPALPTGRVLPWRAGYGVVHQRARYQGLEGHAYSGYRAPDADTLELGSSLAYGVLWGERRWSPVERLAVEAGLRAEAGTGVENGGAVRLAPRLSARLALGPGVALSAGVGRSYQYSQALAPTGPAVGAANSASQIWLLAGRETPAIRSDIATLGGEAWLRGEWLVAANAYLRRSTGVTLPDPTPGLLVDRPLFVSGENIAHGLELSARRLAGRWTAAGSYSYGASSMEAAGLRFAAAEDRAHSADLSSMVRVGSGLRLGAAATAATGAPFTRLVHRVWTCTRAICDADPILGEPNAQRSRPYFSLDLLVDWTRSFRTWDFGVYLQIRNALGYDNAVTYQGSVEVCSDNRFVTPCPSGSVYSDTFQRGLPQLPVLGFRVRF